MFRFRNQWIVTIWREPRRKILKFKIYQLKNDIYAILSLEVEFILDFFSDLIFFTPPLFPHHRSSSCRPRLLHKRNILMAHLGKVKIT